MVRGGLQDEPRTPGERKGGAGKKTERKALFVSEYVIDMNATRAAIRCGYAANSAAVTASRLMKDPWVKAEIARYRRERKQRLRLTAESFDEELAKIAFANMQDYITVNGMGDVHLDFSAMDRDQAAAVQEITSEVYVEPAPVSEEDQAETAVSEELEPQPQGGALKRRKLETVNVKRTKFKLHSKVAALELVGKRLCLLKETVEHSGKVTVVVDL
jgi:phage terminase small subunit